MGWGFGISIWQDSKKFAVLTVDNNLMQGHLESRDSRRVVMASQESEISAMSSAYSISDTGTSEVSLLLFPTRSASRR